MKRRWLLIWDRAAVHYLHTPRISVAVFRKGNERYAVQSLVCRTKSFGPWRVAAWRRD